MTGERRIIEEGYLDVKLPPGNSSRKLHKAWQRRWVEATLVPPLSNRGEPFLFLRLFGTGQRTKELRTSRDGLRLFRCRSRTRPLCTWGLTSGSCVLLYLAAETEHKTQTWMDAIRQALWPTSENSDSKHAVSLIDDDYSFKAGLLGAYGTLNIKESYITLVHPYWGGKLFRYPLDHITDIQMLREAGEENPGSGVFAVTYRELSNGNKDRRLHFYSFNATEIINWLDKAIHSAKDNTAHSESTDTEDLASHLPDKLQVEKQETISVSNGSADNFGYAVINKSDRSEENDHETNSNVGKGLLKLSEIPDLLDSSISSVFIKREDLNNDSSDEDGDYPKPWVDVSDGSPHYYESMSSPNLDRRESIMSHIYAEISSEKRMSIGAQTIYENMEDEYIPPLPPPLPKCAPVESRKDAPVTRPQNLRLEKLSESVEEALKQINRSPCTPSPSQRNNFASNIKKMIKRSSKGAEASPTDDDDETKRKGSQVVDEADISCPNQDTESKTPESGEIYCKNCSTQLPQHQTQDTVGICFSCSPPQPVF